MPAVELTGVRKAFGETKALTDASLMANAGEIHAIVGENGSGKSTLAKIISGVVQADGGEIDVLGARPQTPADAIRHGVATIYQEILLAEELSVWENVFAGADGLWRRSLPVAERQRLAGETLERLAQEPVDPDTIVGTLPLSIKQWIVIARAILRKPKLLIFDESSAALDLEATNRLHQEMLALRQAGACVLLVTHRIAELVKIADGATVLRDGVTVGRLDREHVTEEKLLEMMSATSGHSAKGKRENRVVSTAQKPAIEARGVTLAHGADPIDFRVFPGQIVGLAGLDGAGQAQFISTLAGIAPPHAGDVRVWQASTEALTIRRPSDAEGARIAYVSGDRKREGMFTNLSIIENFGLGLYGRYSGRGGLIDWQALTSSFAREKDRLGIKFGASTDKITTLSGGNQQKVLIARAFALNPRVILLNDPARGVDIGTKQDLYTQLRDFASNGGAVVYLSTEIEEFFDFADRVDVFFNDTVFASLDEADIDEEHLLSAMFGQTGHVEFDEDLVVETSKGSLRQPTEGAA
ncbi:MAG: sugar ABC transporter ATP-binding protein [Roseitalea sp.]|nr:sugar ABC transporter ATP-binding protein [Roseitalea sp.]MBO6953843.1 sugar ABC transporter ATP-binding protein [Rhizobiaceae bacterium]MBO6594136.1 sugar ABC transporter ATP-binding protein [Roseitalea sp.]MBO6601550.1 sugar ABC transporter ATP-binding protein [Roseitalea sp.]MBO6614011.1 sugar ABC transporter ATP-binding protein [Roseitalea sp.]